MCIYRVGITNYIKVSLSASHYEIYECRSLYIFCHFEIYECRSLSIFCHFEIYECRSLCIFCHFEIYECRSLYIFLYYLYLLDVGKICFLFLNMRDWGCSALVMSVYMSVGKIGTMCFWWSLKRDLISAFMPREFPGPCCNSETWYGIRVWEFCWDTTQSCWRCRIVTISVFLIMFCGVGSGFLFVRESGDDAPVLVLTFKVVLCRGEKWVWWSMETACGKVSSRLES